MSPLATFITILRDLSHSNIFSNTTQRVWTAGLNFCWNSLYHHLATVDQTPEAAAAFMVMSCSSKPQQTGERNPIIQPPRCQRQSASVLANFELHGYAGDDDHEGKRREEKKRSQSHLTSLLTIKRNQCVNTSDSYTTFDTHSVTLYHMLHIIWALVKL